MKKIHLALVTAGFALSASAFAFEGTVVKVPASTDHFFIGLEALYLQATDSNGDLDYAGVYSAVGTPDHSNIQSIDSDFGWGWRLILGYEYGAANDFTFNYFRYHPKSSNDNVTAGEDEAVFDPNAVIFNPYESASASVDYEIDQADFTMGQKIAPHRCITLHPYGGLRFARVKRNLETSFVDFGGASSINYTDDSKFSGVGPVAGIDVSFEVGNGFKIVGRFDAGLLAGNMDDDFTLSTTDDDVATLQFTSSADKTRRVVPVANARLGAAYAWDMGNDSSLTFEVGYQASTYKNAVDKLSIGGFLPQPGGTTNDGNSSPFAPTRSSSDLGLHGAYLNLVWKM